MILLYIKNLIDKENYSLKNIFLKCILFWFYYINCFLFGFFSVFHSTGEILYRVELPYMEEITLIYLENNDNNDEYSKC